MTQERVAGRVSRRRAVLARSCGMSVLERAAPCPERTQSDEATGGNVFSSLYWPRDSWRAYSARWMSQLVYNGPSLFVARSAGIPAALITQGCGVA
jgi:hypothetical protein